MDSSDFIPELQQLVALRSASENLVDTLAFVSEVAERLESDPVFGEFELAEFHGSNAVRNPKIHGFTRFDESDGSIGLVIGKWEEIDVPTTLNSAPLIQLSGSMEHFVRESIEKDLASRINESSPAYELALFLDQEKHRINRIRLHILTNLTLSSQFKEELNGEVGGIPFERHIWDLDRLTALYQSSREREAVEIDLSSFGGAFIPCIKASGNDSIVSYLCVISAGLLADLFQRYGSRLLEGNVRSFLGMKGGVNKGIKNTIQKRPELFFAFNNGIAATASEVQVERINGQDVITRLVDLQIVNGGQTTASILNARKVDKLLLDKVTVQMKLTKVEQSLAQELIPDIAQFANTQNKIAVADFFANHPFHRKMQDISRRLLTPARAGIIIQSKWFYERARGQYLNELLYLTATGKNVFEREYPKAQLINKTDLAKYDSTWNLKPYWVSMGSQKNFSKFAGQFESKKPEVTESEYWETVSKKFGDFYFKNMVSMAIVWKAMEAIVDTAKSTWYEGGYRANIVTYTLSKLVYDLRSNGLELDLPGIWKAQQVDNELSRYLDQLAQEVQSLIVNPHSGVKNIGEWCKKEACWSNIAGLRVSEMPLHFAIPKIEFDRLREAGENEGAEDDIISLQKQVLDLTTKGYWQTILSWHKCNDLFTPMEKELVKKASTINGFMRITSDRDWGKLIKLKARAEEEGF